MAYSLREAIWLVRSGLRDVLVGYPSVDRGAIARAAGRSASWPSSITLMIDDVAQLSCSPAVRRRAGVPRRRRVAAGWAGCTWACGARPCARRRLRPSWPRPRPTLRQRVVGVMFYEAQIAGLPDSSPAVRFVKCRSAAELAQRRGAVVEAVEKVVGRAGVRQLRRHRQPRGQLGRPRGHRGDGRVRALRRRPCSTATAPSSRARRCTSRCRWCGVRRRGSRRCSAAGTSRPGRPASRGCRRRPRRGCALLGTEGAGEVQTPVRGPGARGLAIGDRVWFRHAKAGELAERFDTIHVVEDAVRSPRPSRPTAARARPSAERGDAPSGDAVLPEVPRGDRRVPSGPNAYAFSWILTWCSTSTVRQSCAASGSIPPPGRPALTSMVRLRTLRGSANAACRNVGRIPAAAVWP